MIEAQGKTKKTAKASQAVADLLADGFHRHAFGLKKKMQILG